MYTDTKNLANLCVNNTNNAAAKISNLQQDDRFKFKKVWKPLLRLISPKSANTAKSARRLVPNNVNLNNATSASANNTPKELLFTTAETAEEQLVHSTHKLRLVDFSRLQEETEKAITTHKELEFISRVSVDKVPLNTCNNCEYGRNCQHSKYHGNSEANNSTNATTSSMSSATHQLHPHDLNILQAEDGCFVWSDSCEDIDEQLLRQWFWQNSWQFAENATVC